MHMLEILSAQAIASEIIQMVAPHVVAIGLLLGAWAGTRRKLSRNRVSR